MTNHTLTKAQADTLAQRDGEGAVFQVRAGTRHFGWYTDSEVADQMAEFYYAEVFDWYTGDRA